MLCCVLHATVAPAQSAVRIRADNDAYNFWQPPWDRPDEEYSNGVRVSSDFRGPALWSALAPRWLGRRDTSRANEQRVSSSWTLGQDMFTASRHISDPIAPAGARPNAGVLWVQNAERRVSSDRMTEGSVTIGVTGEPSLASSVQRIVHGYTAAWQRPIDWSHQVPFEPLVNVAYDEHRRVAVRAMHLQPHAGVSLGNLLTEARAGVGMHTGWNMTHPWMPAAAVQDYEVAVIADATLRAVAWNGTLSGNLFRPSARMTLRPLVPELQFGVSVRARRATISYLVHQRGAEYLGRSRAHWWSQIQTQWQFAR